MSGQHHLCLYSSSTATHPFVSVFTVFPRVLSNRSRQQPRGRAYSAVWIQAHLHKTSCNYLLREKGREVGGVTPERAWWMRRCGREVRGEDVYREAGGWAEEGHTKEGGTVAGGENMVISERRKERFFIQRFISGPEVVLSNAKGLPFNSTKLSRWEKWVQERGSSCSKSNSSCRSNMRQQQHVTCMHGGEELTGIEEPPRGSYDGVTWFLNCWREKLGAFEPELPTLGRELVITTEQRGCSCV